jgi:hypothetical protein
MWCPAPLPEGELHQRKLRSDKYKPPAGRLLELYESDSSVEADEDTDVEAGVDPAAVVAKSRRRTRSMVAKKSASAVAAAISAMKAAEQKKKKRKRRAASPPAVVTPSIPKPHSGRSSRKRRRRRRRMRLSKSCRSLRTRRQGGRKVLLPRGSGSWCKRRRRMPSNVGWRRSVVLQRRRRGCL